MTGLSSPATAATQEIPDALLTERLAHRVLGWVVASDRYLTGGRSWQPKWRFCPTRKIEDAVRLLQAAAPRRYTVNFRDGQFRVQIQLKRGLGRATGDSLPRVIVLAIARALRLEA